MCQGRTKENKMTTRKSLQERIHEEWNNFKDDHSKTFVEHCVRQELQALRDEVVKRRKIRGILSLGILLGKHDMINEMLELIDERMK